jgi:CheY-like chemotaxis protein
MRHILVVDDDLHTRLAIGIWLKQCGFRVAARAVLPKTCRSARCRCERAAEHFEREGKYGLNCQGEAMRLSLLSSP